MTIEEKARAYDEALKRADSLTEKYGGREFAEYAFPELAESEDERIRKQLIDAIKIGRSNSGISFTEEAASRYIAWLEKQKEQKEQKVDIDKLRRDLYQSGYNDGYQHGKEDAQKEQKTTEWSAPKINGEPIPTENQSVDIPLAGWSEEDEKMLSDLRNTLGCLMNAGAITFKTKKKFSNWLKSLRPDSYKNCNSRWKPSEEQQDYSGLSDLERAIHRGFLCAGVENVPVAIIKETAKEVLIYAKKQLLSYADESNPAIEAMADLERTFECNPDKLPIWLKNELAKKHLDGYTLGREDTMREMMDFLKSHFNCEKAREGTYYKDYERNPEPIPTGIPYQSPQCGTNVTIAPNINSGTSTSKAEG